MHYNETIDFQKEARESTWFDFMVFIVLYTRNKGRRKIGILDHLLLVIRQFFSNYTWYELISFFSLQRLCLSITRLEIMFTSNGK